MEICDQLFGRGSARRYFRKNETEDWTCIFRQRQGSEGLQYRDNVRELGRRRRLVIQMAVGTPRVIRCALTIPVAYNCYREDEQRQRREGDSQKANCFTYIHDCASNSEFMSIFGVGDFTNFNSSRPA